MPELSYDRVLARVRVGPTRYGGALVRFGPGLATVSEGQLRDLALGSSALVGEVLTAHGIRQWWQGVEQRMGRRIRGLRAPNREALPVLELHVAEGMRHLPWEDVLGSVLGYAAWPGVALARPTAVPPRVLVWPLSLPLRVLQLGSALGPIESRDSLFPWSPESEALVLRTASSPPHDPDGWWRDSGWPSVDILEVAPPPGQPTAVQTSTAHPGLVWSLGWLERLCHDFRTRLVVWVCQHAADAGGARTIAHRLAERGGPAVLVVQAPGPAWLQQLYRDVVHDRPLDWAVATSSQGSGQVRPTLLVGQGREELLRVSTPFRSVVDVAAQVAQPGVVPVEMERLGEAVPEATPGRMLTSWRSVGPRILAEWDRSSFVLHESDGAVPMQRGVQELRRELGIPGPVQVSLSTAGRHVIPRLSQQDPGGAVRPVPQVGGSLRPDPVLLGVGIGPSEDLIRVAGAVGLVEEAVFRSPDQPGAWLDVAVLGLTALVDGEPVQRLWLPREGPSEEAVFRVRPGVGRAWRVRICVYHDNLLLQSILMAGMSGPADGSTQGLLATTLAMDQRDVPPGASWFARVEYSLVAGEVTRIPGAERRRLSITANTLDDQRVLFFKGTDLVVPAKVVATIDEQVSAVRRTLAAIARPPVPGVKDPERWPYGFDDDNTDTRGAYDGAMTALANVGWVLYDKVLERNERAAVAAALDPDGTVPWDGPVNGSIISVAHLLLDHVVPWSVVYDRRFDARKRRLPTGEEVEHLACHALDSGPELPPRCGVHESCPLHPERLRERRDSGRPLVDEETVACPRHFWGFRHVLEIPPTRSTDSAPASVGQDGPVQAGFGRHGGLRRMPDHLGDLRELLTRAGGRLWDEGDRDLLVNRLRTELDLDLVYLYCHADEGEDEPVLRLKADEDPKEGLVISADLDGEVFTRHPLVFVNGCRTAAFSPRALSPFIRTLVTNRDASGLIGTEVDVWEQLAVEVGREFLGRFLGVPGMTAGCALRETRLQLLAKGNPLGLAYTLYGLGDLTLRP